MGLIDDVQEDRAKESAQCHHPEKISTLDNKDEALGQNFEKEYNWNSYDLKRHQHLYTGGNTGN